MKKREKGNFGEDLACNYLIENGYEILGRNYFYGHCEIDIIAKKNNCIVFVEVKIRDNQEFGLPEYSITKNKINQIKKAAEGFLLEYNDFEEARIDAITILKEGHKYAINHYENIFK